MTGDHRMVRRAGSETANQRAAALLHRTVENHETLERLPTELAPVSRAEAYGIQAMRAELTGQPVAGWKIAATSPAGQQHINVGGPIAGRVLADRVQQDNGAFSLVGNVMRVAEPEFVFVMRHTLSPRSTEYDRSEVLDAVSELRLGIELPSTRFVDAAAVGELQLIADNACAHDFLLGRKVDADWRSIDLSGTEVTIAVAGSHGTRQTHGRGAAVLGDPLTALTWLVNELSRHHLAVTQGQFVTTGTCCVPPAVFPGDTVRADFDRFGHVICELHPSADH